MEHCYQCGKEGISLLPSFVRRREETRGVVMPDTATLCERCLGHSWANHGVETCRWIAGLPLTPPGEVGPSARNMEFAFPSEDGQSGRHNVAAVWDSPLFPLPRE